MSVASEVTRRLSHNKLLDSLYLAIFLPLLYNVPLVLGVGVVSIGTRTHNSAF